ncbi:PP2C family protein-serine/threonine phosphatase [Janthinobacterium psychrotolerans]|uniref:Serine/threonine protein phosphatase PrpC n=1 Tax=Janthinobacterium psychrotolerans TaxID=1747903 RepID=A0A1A7C0T8_9BURK|nr:protein phosphatase [Janthinobacterium psychrotolerans]OBV38345.1 Serine/threonine protein phosphatase PrpC [Janthinobacterium psychrotolerans]
MHFIKDELDFGPGLDAAAGSSVGAGPLARRENQDNFLLIDAHGHAACLVGQTPWRGQVAGWPAGHVRLAVLDGMGGHGHGREAAEATVQGLLAIPACLDVASLARELDQLHARLQVAFDTGDAQARPPGTTLTLLEIPPRQAPLLYHVGDSRLYEVADAAVTPLTLDHVPATVYAMHGVIDEPQWRSRVYGAHQPQIAQAFILGNVIVDPQVLGSELHALGESNLPPFLAHLGDRRALRLRREASYVLASDGFWSCPDPASVLARWPALCEGRTAAQAATALFDDFLRHPPEGLHSDNLTLLVLRIKASAER